MSLPTGFKRFECSRCGYKFIQRISSPIIRCKKCEAPCIAVDLRGRRLDPYSEMKLYWLKHPQAWEDNITKRLVDNKEGGNKQVRMKDTNWKLPEVVEW